MGRNKIDIEYIDEDRKRTVTLNKRKTGLIKKAYELSVLCGCEIAMVVIDERGQSYLYGSSDATETFRRQLNSKERPIEDVDNDAVKHRVETGSYENDSGGEEAKPIRLTKASKLSTAKRGKLKKSSSRRTAATTTTTKARRAGKISASSIKRKKMRNVKGHATSALALKLEPTRSTSRPLRQASLRSLQQIQALGMRASLREDDSSSSSDDDDDDDEHDDEATEDDEMDQHGETESAVPFYNAAESSEDESDSDDDGDEFESYIEQSNGRIKMEADDSESVVPRSPTLSSITTMEEGFIKQEPNETWTKVRKLKKPTQAPMFRDLSSVAHPFIKVEPWSSTPSNIILPRLPSNNTNTNNTNTPANLTDRIRKLSSKLRPNLKVITRESSTENINSNHPPNGVSFRPTLTGDQLAESWLTSPMNIMGYYTGGGTAASPIVFADSVKRRISLPSDSLKSMQFNNPTLGPMGGEATTPVSSMLAGSLWAN